MKANLMSSIRRVSAEIGIAQPNVAGHFHDIVQSIQELNRGFTLRNYCKEVGEEVHEVKWLMCWTSKRIRSPVTLLISFSN